MIQAGRSRLGRDEGLADVLAWISSGLAFGLDDAQPSPAQRLKPACRRMTVDYIKFHRLLTLQSYLAHLAYCLSAQSWTQRDWVDLRFEDLIPCLGVKSASGDALRLYSACFNDSSIHFAQACKGVQRQARCASFNLYW